jgi:beta-lactamase class D
MREAITASNVMAAGRSLSRLGKRHDFWLDGPLEISAIEQAQFVAALAQRKLPVSTCSQDIVRSILRLEEKDVRVLYGKTGWRFSSSPQLGWWASERRGDIDAAVQRMNADAVEAEKKLEKLNQAGTQSWSALMAALTETRNAFDRANEAAREAFK